MKRLNPRWFYWRSLYVLALVWRRLLFRTTFIAITGSLGKTTAKELLAAISSSRFRTAKTLHNQNNFTGVPRTVLRVRPWHRIAVVEIGSGGPGTMSFLARLVRPDIAIVLTVARTHTNNFGTLENTATEKAKLLEAVPADGLAILNADDPRVRAMAETCRCRVKMFGRAPGLDLWAEELESAWPAGLALLVHAESDTQHVGTNLIGAHWMTSVMAALLAARSCGIPLRAAAAAVDRVEPFMGRMQPVLLPSGATVIRDEENGSPDTLAAALEVLQGCSAERRILVMSDISDSKKKPRARLKDLGRMAARVADLAVFIGDHSIHGEKAAVSSGMEPACARSFMDLRAASQYLASELRKGDLVLLKGRSTDHLSRVFFAQFGTIGCWKTKCSNQFLCDVCDELRPQFDLQTIHRPTGEA